MTKAELRKSFLEQRKALSNEAYEKKNREICSIFLDNIRLNDVRVLHTFIPMADRREPDTLQIITHLQNNFPLIQITVPRVTPGTNKLESFFIDKSAVFQKSKWGIDEPSHGRIVDVTLIDLVIVPLLAFDHDGHRVGYGKGFYDRFLSSCRDNCVKVGLSLFPPVENVGAEVHDVRLNFAVTPDNFYAF